MPEGSSWDMRLLMFCSMRSRSTIMDGVSREEIGSPTLGEYGMFAAEDWMLVGGVGGSKVGAMG